MQQIPFKVGDIVKVSSRNVGEKKVHATAFEGIVIAFGSKGENRTFTLRKVASDKVAVERIFPVNSPSIENIKIIKSTNPRRAKLLYLRKNQK